MGGQEGGAGRGGRGLRAGKVKGGKPIISVSGRGLQSGVTDPNMQASTGCRFRGATCKDQGVAAGVAVPNADASIGCRQGCRGQRMYGGLNGQATG